MIVKNICCIGAGYVGGPTMAVIASKCPNININVVDSNHKRIKRWNGPLDALPIFEPGLDDIVKKTRGRNLFFSSNISLEIDKAEIIFIAVNTPTRKIGPGAGMAADLTYIESCAKDIAKYSKSDKIIVEKSTVPIMTAARIKEILKKTNNKIKFEVLSNPEFLAEGTAINDLLNPDRVLLGGENSPSGKKAIKLLVDIYKKWIPKKKILTTNVWSSELSKLASNAMLAQRISSINSLSALCEKTGADIDELSKAIGMDNRIGPKFLKASVGFGGSCFQKDILNLVYLCDYYNLREVAEYWHQVVKINDYQKNRFAEEIVDHFGGNLSKKKVAVLGWAFKSNTNDSRESASIKVSEILYKAGATLFIIDPMVSKKTITNDIKDNWKIQIELDDKRINFLKIEKFNTIDFDVAAILTEWESFKGLLFNENTFLFDGRRILNKGNIKFKIGSFSNG